MTIEDALTRGLVLVVAAHASDETIGAGGILGRMPGAVVCQVTDSAAHDPVRLRCAGFDSWDECFTTRRRELLAALALAGIGADRLRFLEVPDLETTFRLVSIARSLAELIAELRPGTALTHAYEGGHPDNDSTAFAVHQACRMVPEPPLVVEFTSYHAGRTGDFEAGRFLWNSDQGTEVHLTEAEQERKRRMVACFESQAGTLREFPVEDVERFRFAPDYDFTQPPHPGPVYYRRYDWGIMPERWQYHAARAVQQLEAVNAR